MRNTGRSETPSTRQASPGLWASIARRWLRNIEFGRITVLLPDGSVQEVRGRQPGPTAVLSIHRNRAVRRILMRGDIGLAEGFMEGDWSSPDLGVLLAFGFLNEASLAGSMTASRLLAPLLWLGQKLRANNRAGSRRNIAYHYDLGNKFYQLWLDQTMTYSSALFSRDRGSLEDGQKNKYQRIIDSLELTAEDHVLDVGCGWGGFAEHAATHAGCRVTGITLSKEQATFARKRLKDKGLDGRTEIRMQDYRDVSEHYDKVVSIEMFEAVGEKNWPVFFDTLRERLKPAGRAVLQIITVADSRFDAYRAGVDFIRQYVFPGGMLPSNAVLAKEISAANLVLANAFFFGSSYAETLRRWQQSFQERWAEIAALGFDERFRRMWTYYLSVCEAGFRAGTTDVGQYAIERV